MKRLAVGLLLTTALALPAVADPFKRAMRPDTMSPADIASAMKTAGYETLGTPARNGDYYDLDATDARGAKLRIRADALFGDVVSVTPAPHNWNGGGGARIIRVPVPQDRPVAQAEKSARHAAISRDVAVPEAVKPARPVKPDPMPPRRRPFSSNEPRNAEPVVPVEPALPKRTVLSAPPLPVEGPSPIRPLPRWRETNDTRPVEPVSPAPAADGADPK